MLGIDIAGVDGLINETGLPLPPRDGAPDQGWGRSADERVRRSQEEWLVVRAAARGRDRESSELAVWLYPESVRTPGGHMLAGAGWLLDTPVPLEDVRLEFDDTHPAPPALDVPLDHVLPLTDRSDRYLSFSRAVRDLVRPRLLENRVSYRLLGVDAVDRLQTRMSSGSASLLRMAWRDRDLLLQD